MPSKTLDGKAGKRCRERGKKAWNVKPAIGLVNIWGQSKAPEKRGKRGRGRGD